MLASLHYQEYRLFWIGNASSNIGIWLLGAGRLWLMYEITNSEIMLGAVAFASAGPILIFSVWGGVAADRVNRIKLVTCTRAMFAVTAILTGSLVASNLILPWHLIVISLFNGILLSFDIPCRQAIVPNLVPRQHLVNAISLQSMLGTGSAVIGPSLLPLLIQIWGISGVFFSVGFAYIFTTVMFARLKSQEPTGGHDHRSPWFDLISGLIYVRNQPIFIALIAMGVVAGLFASSLPTLFPVFATENLGGGIGIYGGLLLSNGIGGLIGAAVLANFVKVRDSSLVQVLAGIGLGIGFVSLAGVAWVSIAILVIGIVGACSVGFGTINNTLMQSLLEDAYRGRVMSIHQLGWGASAIGGLVVGFLAEMINVPFTFALCGSVTAISTAAISLFVSRHLKEKI